MIMFGFGLLTLSALLYEIDLYEGLENAIEQVSAHFRFCYSLFQSPHIGKLVLD